MWILFLIFVPFTDSTATLLDSPLLTSFINIIIVVVVVAIIVVIIMAGLFVSGRWNAGSERLHSTSHWNAQRVKMASSSHITCSLKLSLHHKLQLTHSLSVQRVTEHPTHTPHCI